MLQHTAALTRPQHAPQRCMTACHSAREGVFASVAPERAFLPERDPLTRLPDELLAYEHALDDLPNLALTSNLRKVLQGLPRFDLQQLTPSSPQAAEAWQRHLQTQPPPANSTYTPPHELHRQQHDHLDPHQPATLLQPPEAELGELMLQQDAGLWRAYQVLSFLSHAYMWCAGPDVPPCLPAVLAQPWATVAAALHMPPVLVYATYNLMNWRRLDPSHPIALGNLAVRHQFLGGVDEAWFRLVHVAIEAAAAPAIAALQPLQEAAQQEDGQAMERQLSIVAAGLVAMQQLLDRTGEHCDPYIYYQRVRVPMSGWRNNPALPQGLIYEGLWGNQPQQLYGETGAQSAIVPAFDAVLGVEHQEGWLQRYLLDMRAHMPPSHRAYLANLKAGPSVRAAVNRLTATAAAAAAGTGSGSHAASGSSSSLVEAYNEAVHQLEAFRAQHRGFAQRYIAQWAKKDVTGSGGSDFMPALTGYKQTTATFKIS